MSKHSLEESDGVLAVKALSNVQSMAALHGCRDLTAKMFIMNSVLATDKVIRLHVRDKGQKNRGGGANPSCTRNTPDRSRNLQAAIGPCMQVGIA